MRQVWHIDIAVAFQTPVTSFSADVYSHLFSTGLIYTGIDATGQTFTLGAPAVGHFQTRFAHVDIAAPAGGYLTGFHFSQAEPSASILLAMDNLSYTVPETIGLPTFALAICGLLFVHRRIKAARS